MTWSTSQSEAEAASTSATLTNPTNSRPPISTQTSNSDLSSIHSVQSNSTSSSSAWRINLELSLPTQRRLIRKPLPHLPGQKPIGSGNSAQSAGIDSEDSMLGKVKDLTVANKLKIEGERVENWWPDMQQLIDNDDSDRDREGQLEGNEVDGSGNGNHVNQTHVQTNPIGFSSTSKQVFQSLLLYTLALPPPSLSSPQLPFNFHSDLSSSLLACILYFSDPSILDSLQRTLSIQWRAETQLRSTNPSEVGNPLLINTGVGAAISSRWAKLAWPVNAIRGGYSSSSSTGFTTPISQNNTWNSNQPDDSSSLLNENLNTQKIRKRDIAIKILTNAVWLARTYGGSPLNLSSVSEDLRTGSNLTGKGLQEVQESESKEIKDENENATPTPTPKKRERGKAPNFIRLAAPTTALTSAAQDSNSASTSTSGSQVDSSASSLKDQPTAASEDLAEAKATTSLDPISRTSSPVPSIGSTQKKNADERPPPPSHQSSSKAVERLASLNAAAGAALAAQVKQYAEQHPGEVVDLTQFSTSNPNSTSNSKAGSRPRSISSVSSLSSDSQAQDGRSSKPLPKEPPITEAQRKETEAIRKAELKHLRKLKREFENWSRMVVSRICLKFLEEGEEIPKEEERQVTTFEEEEEEEVDEEEGESLNGRRRSGTLTGKTMTSLAQDSLNALTFRSQKNEEGEEGEKTIKGKSNSSNHNKIPIYPSKSSDSSQGSSKISSNSDSSPKTQTNGKEIETSDEEDLSSILVWKKNVWKGEFLFNQSPPPSGDSEDAKRLKVVGGTFFVRRIDDEKVRKWVKSIVEMMVSVQWDLKSSLSLHLFARFTC